VGNQPLQRQRKSSNQLLPYSNRPLKRNPQCNNNRDSQYNNQPKSTQLSNGSNIPQRNNRLRWTSFTSPNSESAITVLDVGIFNKVAFLFPVLMPSREATLLARSVARERNELVSMDATPLGGTIEIKAPSGQTTWSVP
jgi:hypothetical protein